VVAFIIVTQQQSTVVLAVLVLAVVNGHLLMPYANKKSSSS